MSCPPTKPAIAVITPNILIGLGLRTILEKVGPPGEIAVFDSFTEFIASGPERYFHYFAAMQVFMRHRTFFLENSHKTILLGKGYSAQFARMRQIDIFGGEERLVHDLLCLRSEAPRPDHALPRQNGTPAANLLSVRETEVLTLIAQGLLNKQIADRLQIGLTTVISHRRSIMQTFGAQVTPSPSMSPRAGKDILPARPNYQGSLGTAISEAIELAQTTPNCKYTLGSVLRHVALHQTVIGLEAEKQMEMAGEYPDTVIACFGGGSNFGGIAFPFMRHNILEGKKTRFVAAEPASCPKLTRGKFQYDFGDEAGYTPLLPMFTLGHNFAPANIHAGGLRYHGAGVIVSQLLKDGYMEAVDITQLESFDAGCLFAQAEGIIPAPESCHDNAATIREANKCKETGEEKVILFNLSGHGLIDMASYDKYLSGDLVNYELTDADIQKNLDEIGNLA